MENPMDMTGRTVLVTGASSGIGRETAILLSQLGASVVLVGRDAGRLAETQSLMLGQNHRLEAFDLNEVEAIPQWMKRLSATTGPLHGLVHSAGVVLQRGLRFLTDRDLQEVMRINVHAAVALAKGFRQKGVCGTPGSVVLLTSTIGLIGLPGLSAYAASKGALISMSKSLAVELAPENIRVNCVAPSLVRTEMVTNSQKQMTPEQFASLEAAYPLGLGEPRDVANAIAFLLADTGRWITGTTLVVDGGITAH